MRELIRLYRLVEKWYELRRSYHITDDRSLVEDIARIEILIDKFVERTREQMRLREHQTDPEQSY